MIDTDEYIEMWNDHLLGSEGVQDLMNALIAEVKRLQYWDEEMDRVIATLDEHSWGSSDGDVHEIVTHLLAEVKRLREANENLQRYYEKCIELGCVAGIHENWFTHNGFVICEDCGLKEEEKDEDMEGEEK